MKKKRKQKSLEKRKENNHHIIAESRNGVTTDNNIKRLQVRTHNAIHFLFWIQTPPEIIRTVANTFETSLTEEFKKELFDLLNRYWDKAIKKECYRKWHINNRQIRSGLFNNQ